MLSITIDDKPSLDAQNITPEEINKDVVALESAALAVSEAITEVSLESGFTDKVSNILEKLWQVIKSFGKVLMKLLKRAFNSYTGRVGIDGEKLGNSLSEFIEDLPGMGSTPIYLPATPVYQFTETLDKIFNVYITELKSMNDMFLTIAGSNPPVETNDEIFDQIKVNIGTGINSLQPGMQGFNLFNATSLILFGKSDNIIKPDRGIKLDEYIRATTGRNPDLGKRNLTSGDVLPRVDANFSMNSWMDRVGIVVAAHKRQMVSVKKGLDSITDPTEKKDREARMDDFSHKFSELIGMINSNFKEMGVIGTTATCYRAVINYIESYFAS